MKKHKVYLAVIILLVLLLTPMQPFERRQVFNTIDSTEEKPDIIADISEPQTAVQAGFIPTHENISNIKGFDELQQYLYTIDETAYVTGNDLDIPKLLKYNFKTDLRGMNPKILIFHTHSQEAYKDSSENDPSESIIGIGRKLAETLVNKYNVAVIHDVGQYDVKDGKVERGGSYENMERSVQRILNKYPSIEIAIDLHRDGVPENVHLVTSIDGKPTARVMFFNGITRENRGGLPKELPGLYNPYINQNLAFSLQMQLTANELFPGFTRRIYIKPYRYSLHLCPKSLLIEVGANTNTFQEALNAVPLLAKVLMNVLQ